MPPRGGLFKSPLRHHLPLGAAGCRLLPLPAARCHERSGVSDGCVNSDVLFGFWRFPWWEWVLGAEGCRLLMVLLMPAGTE